MKDARKTAAVETPAKMTVNPSQRVQGKEVDGECPQDQPEQPPDPPGWSPIVESVGSRVGLAHAVSFQQSVSSEDPGGAAPQAGPAGRGPAPGRRRSRCSPSQL